MPETENVATQTEQKKPTIASVGKPTSVPMNFNQQQSAVADAEQKTADENVGAVQQQVAPEFTEEQKTAFFKTLGIEYKGDESLEEVKQKLNYKAPVEQTEEEKKAILLAEEKEILDLFISGGGTPEQFVSIKNVMNADLKELSRSEKLAELTAAGFDKDEAEDILKERYYQNQLDGLEFDDDGIETKEEFELRKAKLEKKVAFFNSKLENSAAHAKTQAEQVYNNFKQLISDKKLQTQKEVEHAANAEAFLKTLPRKQTFELGQLNGQPLAPVHIDVPESDISEVAEFIKSPAKIKQFLFNEDGSFNLANITDAFLSRQTKTTIARNSLLEGQTRQVNIFRQQFPHTTASSVGIGGAPQKNGNEKGKLASMGKAQVH